MGMQRPTVFEQGHHHNGDKAAWRPHLWCLICGRRFGDLEEAVTCKIVFGITLQPVFVYLCLLKFDLGLFLDPLVLKSGPGMCHSSVVLCWAAWPPKVRSAKSVEVPLCILNNWLIWGAADSVSQLMSDSVYLRRKFSLQQKLTIMLILFYIE